MANAVNDIQYYNGRDWLSFHCTPIGMYEQNALKIQDELKKLRKQFPKRKFRLATLILPTKK